MTKTLIMFHESQRQRRGDMKARGSANGARYDSQGQVRSEAKHVAPGSIPKRCDKP
jgi:hypothetical protein